METTSQLLEVLPIVRATLVGRFRTDRTDDLPVIVKNVVAQVLTNEKLDLETKTCA